MSDIYVAQASGMVLMDGRRYRIRRGQTTARAGHPILKAHGNMFEVLQVDFDTTVEQATAAPGEKRNVGVSRKPPKSGPGSGESAWRAYAATQDTGMSGDELADLSRDELIELVG